MNAKNIMKKSLSSIFLGLLSVTLLILTYSSNTWAGTKYFWVYAKSSIEKPGSDSAEAPPGSLGLNLFQYAKSLRDIRDGCIPSCPPAPFDETPNMSSQSGSQEPSGEYRLYGHFRIKGRCSGSTAQFPLVASISDEGGDEGSGLSGSAYMDPLAKNIGGAYVVNYVLSGQPHSVIEAAAFTPVKARGNKKIWQKGQIIMGCTSSGTPTAWLSTSSSNWKGSAFPTHNVSLWNATSSGPTGSSPRQTLQNNQGKFWELWDLDSVPSP